MARKAAPEINAGSMADIAFLLLIFFLVTTTMDVDTGITRKLPPPVETEDDIDVKDRNVLKILVNSQDRLLIDGKPGDISQLKDKVIDFMTPHPDNEEYPETTMKLIDELNREVIVSKGIISLKNDRGTSYDMYIAVQNQLALAFNELKDRFSMEQFKMKYSVLIDDDKIKAVNSAIPVAISEAEPEDIGGK